MASISKNNWKINMTIVINYTRKSGRIPETLTDVKSYRDTSVWSIEVIFNDGKIESFYAVESVKELSEPEVVIYQLSAEEWMDAMDKQDLQVQAKKLGYNII